jgi:hypothetical protein
MNWRRGAILASVVGLTAFGQLPQGVQAEPSDTQIRQRVSRAHNIPVERLAVAAIDTNRGLNGTQLEVAKVLDTTTGQTYLDAVDASGNTANLTALEASTNATATKQQGAKVDARLQSKLDKAKPSESIPVAIWLRTSDVPVHRVDAPTDAQAAQQALDAQLTALEQHLAPQLQDMAKAVGRTGATAQTARFAPAVFAKLNRGQLQKLANDPSIDTIYSVEEHQMFEDDAATTERAYRVWQLGNFGAGASSRPVVHEPDGIADFNPYLNNATHPVVFWCSDVDLAGRCPSAKNIQDHASEVSGVIASTHPLVRGIAPNAQLLLSANFQTFDPAAGFQQKMVDSLEWARANGGAPINMSWGSTCGLGQQDFDSRYADWATKFLAATLVISSGNTTGLCGAAPNDFYVSSPGLAWNVITVGSQFDLNNGFWSGDGLSGFSRYVNPVGSASGGLGGQEKPEVVAVGQDVTTTDAAGGDGLTPAGVNGTSFSAPQVAGQVVQMLSRMPGQSGWPETNKAAVLASAYHDIVPGTDQDGVGSVVMNHSDDTYRFGRFINGSATCASFSGCAGDFLLTHTDVISIPATQVGKPVRVAIAWDSDSNGNTTDGLGADIDLCIVAPDNVTIVGCSSSFANAWEMVEFTPTVAGAYDVRLHLFNCPNYPGATEAERCSAGTVSPSWPGTFYGIAWSFKDVPNICSGVPTVTTNTSFSYGANTANGPTYFDTYAGWPTSQSGREHVLWLNLTSTKDITVSDNNANLDIHVLQFPGCAADPIVPTVVAQGTNTASKDNAPPGRYFIVLDGVNGAVGSASVTVSLTGP